MSIMSYDDDKRKKQKFLPCKTITAAEGEEGKGEDRISGLPQEILHHILTLLLTKEAVRTRVVSKKWNSLWTSIPVLDFGQRLPHAFTIEERMKRVVSDKLLMNFLDFLITSRNHNSPIHVFSVYCSRNFDTYRLHTWLSYIATHRIQHLTLKLHLDRRVVFPCSLFTCNSLKVFHLEMPCIFSLPTTTTTSLPSLKSLSLKFVKFVRNVDIHQLFSNCPLLEELYSLDCTWGDVKINISAPALKLLHIFEDMYDDPFLLDTCEVDIFAPNITTFEFRANLPKRFGLSHLPFLDHATVAPHIIERHVRTMNPGTQNCAINFLQAISRVQHLKLQRDIVQILFRNQCLSPHFPTFNHLITLHLDWSADTYLVPPCLTCCIPCPTYKFFTYKRCHYFDDNSSTAASLPQCLLLHLRCIMIRKICGFTGEVYMIKFLLKNATVLEEMTVTVDTRLANERPNIVSRQLNAFPISSQTGCLQKNDFHAPWTKL